MGYDTKFKGSIKVSPRLLSKHQAYLKRFSDNRRVQRDPDEARKLPDETRFSVGLDVGVEGEFYTGADPENAGQGFDESVMDANEPPITQPSLWCMWVPSSNGRSIKWNGGEKFHDHTTWMQYLIKNFLKPWGYRCDGEITWVGEDPDDTGVLKVRNNEVLAEGTQRTGEADKKSQKYRKDRRKDPEHLKMLKQSRESQVLWMRRNKLSHRANELLREWKDKVGGEKTYPEVTNIFVASLLENGRPEAEARVIYEKMILTFVRLHELTAQNREKVTSMYFSGALWKRSAEFCAANKAKIDKLTEKL